jgi:hypothetical protein
MVIDDAVRQNLEIDSTEVGTRVDLEVAQVGVASWEAAASGSLEDTCATGQCFPEYQPRFVSLNLVCWADLRAYLNGLL